MLPELFGFEPIFTRAYPVREVAVTHAVRTERFDLKDKLGDEVLSNILVRIEGNIVKAGAGVGTATGRENPEGIIRAINLRHRPAFSINGKDSFSSRGIISWDIFQRGYGIRAADITDAAATVAIDFFLPLRSRNPQGRLPVEWSMPLKQFDSVVVEVECGGRDQLFTGGTNTWDLTDLTIEIWAEFDDRVALPNGFHLVDEFEFVRPITASQRDLLVEMEKGFVYTDLLFMTERDDVLVNDIMNHIAIESGGRSWLPKGGANNALAIQRWSREKYVNNAAEVLTGLYYINGLRDGMFTRAVEAASQKLAAILDVTLGGGTTRNLTVRGRRVVPFALK